MLSVPPHSVIPRAFLPLVFSDATQQCWNWKVLEVSSKKYRLALPARFGKAELTSGNAAVVGSPSAGDRLEYVVVSASGAGKVPSKKNACDFWESEAYQR